jgi:bifunctional DNase/RNase
MQELNHFNEVRLHSLQAINDGSCIVILEEVTGSRLLPIHAGMNEVNAIALHAGGVTLPRPMTHDLMQSLIEALGGRVLRVDIHEVQDDVFHARLTLERDGHRIAVDARPSDAINLAIRAGAPIFVAEDVFKRTDLVLKPIEEDEVARFRRELERTDPLEALRALEGKPAPVEPGTEELS